MSNDPDKLPVVGKKSFDVINRIQQKEIVSKSKSHTQEQGR